MNTRPLIISSVGIAVMGFVGFSYISTPAIIPQSHLTGNRTTISQPLTKEFQTQNNQLTIDKPLINESDDIETARSALSVNDYTQYTELRARWKGTENLYADWFLLDAEYLQRSGKDDDVIALLKSDSLNGFHETERLTRLAAINLSSNPGLAWESLDEASLKDPTNTDIHVYKAGLLESSEKIGLAEKEYQIALQKDPNSLFLKEQLGEFYLRTGQYNQAVDIYKKALSSSPTDSDYLKAFFLSRVIVPFAINSNKMPEGNLIPLTSYVKNLPPESFWNEALFEKLREHSSYLTHNQETYWLRLLNALSNHNEISALEIIEKSLFKNTSWAPKIESSLAFILKFRQSPQTHSNNFSYPSILTAKSIVDEDQFLALLDQLSSTPQDQLSQLISLDVYDILVSQTAIALPFLMNGWNEIAVQFSGHLPIPSNFPAWIAYELAQAIYATQGIKPALEFAIKQSPSPELTLIIGKLSIEDGKREEAFSMLSKIYKNNDLVGSQASLLIAPLFLAQKNPKGAKEAILAHADLSNNIEAREILARAFFDEGDTETTYRIYQSLEPYSVEAKSFLAHEAFVNKNWELASKLTKELLNIYPNSAVLKENFRKIVLEQTKIASN